MKQDGKVKKYEDLLMAALQFDEDDLAANRDGTYSSLQTAWLRRHRSRQATVAGIMSAIVTCIVLIPVAVGGANALIPMLGFAALFTALALLIAGVNGSQATRDLRNGLRVVEGRVELDTKPGQNSAAYYVKVAGRKFTVKKGVFLTFKNGDPYRIYYAPNTRRILSAEWLRDDSPFEDDAADSDMPKPKHQLEAVNDDTTYTGAENILTDDGELHEDVL